MHRVTFTLNYLVKFKFKLYFDQRGFSFEVNLCFSHNEWNFYRNIYGTAAKYIKYKSWAHHSIDWEV